MKFRIHGTWPDGTQDCVVVEGNGIEEIREEANAAAIKRGWTDLWSEELKEPEDA